MWGRCWPVRRHIVADADSWHMMVDLIGTDVSDNEGRMVIAAIRK
jgi:hypothetical protein